MLPVGNKKVELVLEIGRVQCRKCGTIKQPCLNFADPKKHKDRKKDERVRLQQALQLNEPLAIGYYMKERTSRCQITWPMFSSPHVF